MSEMRVRVKVDILDGLGEIQTFEASKRVDAGANPEWRARAFDGLSYAICEDIRERIVALGRA